jgi:hypothetical protein
MECYGGDIEELADVVVDFDAMSPEETMRWNLGEWTSIAQTLGFDRELAEAAAAIRGTRLGLIGLHSAALAAFERWSSTPRRPLSSALSPVSRVARAKVRHEVLLGLAHLRPARLWAIDEPADRLRAAACFARGSATEVSGRAFLVDAAANFFHADRTGERQANTTACGWQTPVLLSLGTFPWVYGSKLHRTAAGLDWDASAPWNPATVAMRLSTSLWQPLGNFQQDALQVVQCYRHYVRTAELALAQVPAWPGRHPGGLTRRGLLLQAQHGCLDVLGANSPLGYLSAAAHNFIIRRFAAFFSVRRAYVRAAANFPTELRRAIADNPDPCLRRVLADPNFTTSRV